MLRYRTVSRRQNGLHDLVAWTCLRYLVIKDLQTKQLITQKQNWTQNISDILGSCVFDDSNAGREIGSSSLSRGCGLPR
jgi:hypothetical protein